MFKVDINLYGDFLINFLNLQLTINKLNELIDNCTKIIPIENIEECKRLIDAYDDEAKIRQIFENLPHESNKQHGKFYRDEEMNNYINISSVTIIGGHVAEKQGSSIEYPEAVEWLLEDAIELKDNLTTLIQSMASCNSLLDMITNAHLINLRKEFPIQRLFLTEKDIEYKPDVPKVWGLGSQYVNMCVSQAFFWYFLQKKNFNRIKSCHKCNKFFISAKIDNRIKFCPNCSQKCKMSKEKRREYQKKYRQKRKKEKLAKEREARIKNLVNKGWTGKEAEKIIEADSMM